MDIDQLIYKNLSGEANDDEQKRLKEWLLRDEGNCKVYQEMEYHWRGEQDKIARMRQQAWDNFLQKKEKMVQMGEVSTSQHRHLSSATVGGVFEGNLKKFAAVIAFLATIGLAFWIWSRTDPGHPVVETVSVAQTTTKSNPPGRKSTFTLPDGTKVKLNAASTLTYSESFGNARREVYLTGEAFFDVVENPEKPFFVHTGEVYTKVKGTSFNVKSNHSHNKLNIAVVTGLVEVGSTVDTLQVVPGEMVEYGQEKGKQLMDKRLFSPKEIAWVEGLIVFRKASLKEIEQILEQWYGVEINIKRKIELGEGFTGEYHGQSLWSVMESMSFAMDFQYEIDKKNNMVTIW